MRGAAALATYLGRALIVAGLILIALAWNGAASFDTIQQQFPYLLSGSMAGLAMIIIGAGLEYVQNLRTFTAKRARQMAELNVAVVRLVSTLREQGGFTPAHQAEPAAVPVGVGGRGPGAPDATAFAPAGGATAASTADELVVAGRSSFHQPSCHLVSGRDDMARITRLEAEAQSLSACRVCKP